MKKKAESAVIKNDKKKPEVPNLLRRCRTTRNVYGSPSDTKWKEKGQPGLESKAAAGRE